MSLSKYNNKPSVTISGYENSAWAGYEDIAKVWQGEIPSPAGESYVLAIECYPGVLLAEIQSAVSQHFPEAECFLCEEALKSEDQIMELIGRNLTDDRVRGVMSHHELIEFYDAQKLQGLKEQVSSSRSALKVIIGHGATLVAKPNLLVYADMARWEIQLRYRSEKVANFAASNFGEDFLRMYKRGFFVDWRVADRHKRGLYDQIDYLLDTNAEAKPKMISGEAFHAGMRQTASQPFRVVPYFDPGPWGGQWMKDVCNLDQTPPNYAWSFDGVPEENSLLMVYGDIEVEVPSINVVFTQAIDLLGTKVHARFGEEFPIRFDFLDTIEGGNLSLQVHPTTGYIYEQFGMAYTQDESYYILDAKDDACVYLGLKDDAQPEDFQRELEEAQSGGPSFDAEKFVNKIPAKKHDHFLIPGGTIHCSGKNAMVLEISATPYIFTFKLWDWGRLGMDGKPRPVHLDHGMKVIDWDLRTERVNKELVNDVTVLHEEEGAKEERTGLHEREFIESRRHWFSKPVEHKSADSVCVMNLVEGEEVTLKSPSGAFEPQVFHYAETFIVPAGVGDFIVEPSGPSKGKTCATVKAFVRT